MHARAFAAIAQMHLHLAMREALLQPLPERHVGVPAGVVVQHEGFATRFQRFGHRQQRGDADAGGQQHVALARMQRKQVARRGDAQAVAGAQLLAQMPRAATRGVGQLHAQQIVVAHMRCAGDRVLADHAVGQMQVHMRAGLEGRQFRADRLQPDRALAMALVEDLGNADLVQLHGVLLGGQRRKKSL